MENLTGKQLGPYRVVAPLGEGGMAAVYKAYQPAMDRYVAVKVLPRHLADNSNFVARFHQEAKVIAKLQHPHILSVFDFGDADGYTYLVMPFVEYGTLHDLLNRHALPLNQIKLIVSQVGDALDYAHSRGLVHRDVKPSNVLVDGRGHCLLTDFGIARMVEGSAHLTQTGAIIGTPAYMSPEQGLSQKVDGRSDIYSLGVMLYQMATGRVPFDAETPMAIVVKHIHDPLPPPRTINPALPETVERVILKALAKKPADRYQTAGAMVEALKRADTGQPERETRRLLEAAPRRRRAFPIWAGVATIIGAVTVLVGGVWFGLYGGRTEDPATESLATQVVAVTDSPSERTEFPTEAALSAGTLSPLVVSDDFNNPSFDGSFNTTIWSRWNPTGEMVQRDGVLTIAYEYSDSSYGAALGLRPIPENWTLQTLRFFEGKFMLSDELGALGRGAGGMNLALEADLKNNRGWATVCSIGHDEAAPSILCSVFVNEVPQTPVEYYSEIGIPTAYGAWHTLRIELGLDSRLTFLVDNRIVGTYLPEDAVELEDSAIRPVFGLYNAFGLPAKGYVDEIRLGHLRGQPKLNFARYLAMFHTEQTRPWPCITL